MKQTIERLRERPHEERSAIAATVAFIVVGVLLLGWVVIFFHDIGANASASTSDTNTDTSGAQVQAATAQFKEQYASTTQGIQQVTGEMQTIMQAAQAQPGQVEATSSAVQSY